MSRTSTSDTDASLDVAALDETSQAALQRLIIGLADTKRILGIRYSDWLLGAPSLETGIAASSMCQDEWGHARLLYAMVKDFDQKPIEFENHRDAALYQSVDALDKECSDWAGVISMNVVIDSALSVALEAFSEGCYGTAQSRVPKMLGEEAFHRDFGFAWFTRLATAAPEARARLIEATTTVLPRTLAWLAPDDEAHRTLAALGVTLPAKALIARFKGVVGPVLDQIDVNVEAIKPEREGWDASRGRGPGHPDDEAIERARGDRNRALFVE